MWVKWIYKVYMKGVFMDDYVCKSDVSWYWRKIYKIQCKIRDILKDSYNKYNDYIILVIYKILLGFGVYYRYK